MLSRCLLNEYMLVSAFREVFSGGALENAQGLFGTTCTEDSDGRTA